MHQPPGFSRSAGGGHGTGADTTSARRIQTSLFLASLTPEDGVWLERTLPTLLRRARPRPGAVQLEDVVLRYRPGRLSVADALDVTAILFAPLVSAGVAVERRGEWYIADEDDDETDDDGIFRQRQRPATLAEAPRQDLLVSARLLVDADGDDAGAAALYWAALALNGPE